MYKNLFTDKKILITGGTGSFGHHIVRRLLKYEPKEIRIFSRDENKQFHMSHELGVEESYPKKDNISFFIGDVRDKSSVLKAMEGIDLVYHAAALKQVPSCEYFVWEAIQTNIIGAKNVIEAAIEKGVKKVIAISTDKAVKPVNAMGMTKALQEKLITTANYFKENSETVFACVRYGNVVASRGSVIPLFKKQIETGGPVTITTPEMTRFILTLTQAINLVFKATQMSVGGEIFVLKVPAVKITDLARVMIKELSPNKKIEIKEIGIRPGEKIHEVLVSETEAFRTVEEDDFYIILPQINLPKTFETYRDKKLVTFTEYSSQTTKKLKDEEIIQILKKEKIIR